MQRAGKTQPRPPVCSPRHCGLPRALCPLKGASNDSLCYGETLALQSLSNAAVGGTEEEEDPALIGGINSRGRGSCVPVQLSQFKQQCYKMLHPLQVDWPCLQGPLSPGHHEHPLLPKPLLSPWLVGAPLWDKIGGSGKAGGQTADSWGLGSAPPAPPKLVLQSLQGLGAKLGHLELFSPADPAAQVATAKSAEDPISSHHPQLA